MRIAIWHNLPSGGGKRALYDQVRGLLARHHHIEAWCPPTADQTYLPLSGLVAEHVVPLTRPSRTSWDIRLRVPMKVGRELSAMDHHCRICAEEICAAGFDILLAHPCMFFRTSAIGRYVHLPKVLYLQEPYRRLYEALPRLPWLAAPPSRLPRASLARLRETAMVFRTLHNARIQGREEVDNAAAFDRILVNSLFSRESVLRAYGLDSQVCYLGTDLDRFVDQGRPREHLVVSLGSFSPEKNPRLVLEAVGLLPAPRPEVAWIGNFATPGIIDELRALSASLNVVFTPYLRVQDDVVISLLNRASAMIYAPRLEPFGLAPIEAAACGLPVVAVAEGGVRETVIDNETGYLVGGDPASIANATGKLLSDRGLASRLGQAGRLNAVRRWSLDHLTDRIEQALARVIGECNEASQALATPNRRAIAQHGTSSSSSALS
jgi:glycosyltransferase involved in cell wall biosynthesis